MRKASCLLSRFVLLVVFTACFFITSPRHIFAGSIVINEFSSDTTGSGSDQDWVEIYNASSDSIDLSLYRLRDSTVSNKKDLSGILLPNGFLTFDWSDTLNKSGDVIKLVLISGESIIDQVGYGSGGSDLPALSTNQSGGRQADGNGQWVIFSTNTKGASNNTAIIVPTATVIPTNTPIPTDTPKVPTPTRTPTPQNTPTPIKTPTPIPTSTNKVTTTPSLTETPTSISSTSHPSPKKVLGVSTKSALLVLPTATPTKKPEPSIKGEEIHTEQNFIPVFFIGGGVLLLISCGILTFQPQIKQIWKNMVKK